MVSFIPDELHEYTVAHSSPESDLQIRLAEETRRTTRDSHMMIGHIEGLLLRLLVRSCGARRVLEIGTFTGYSALAMAEGLPDDGVLITCDIDTTTTAIARKYWAQSPHGAKIDLHLGPALETISGVDGPLDFVFIDADKENYVNYWEAVVPKVRSGGIIAADNVLWSGEVLSPDGPDGKAIAGFNRHVVNDERVETVMLPVRDGLTVAVKR